VREVRETHAGRDGIVCNAAIQVVSGVQASAHGYELTFDRRRPMMIRLAAVA